MRAQATATAERAPEPVARPVATTRVLQRKCACGGAAGYSGSCEGCRKDKLHRKAHGHAGTDHGIAPAIVHEVLNSPGRPLDTETRAYFEPRFGHDFSKVRIHDDAQASHSADAVNAAAYTAGENVTFSIGRYSPYTDDGRKLLAHELGHVVQQRKLGPQAIQRKGGEDRSAEGAKDANSIDPALAEKNRTIEESLLGAADDYFEHHDLRWFFAYAHGTITQQINRNITAFEQPNELLRFNIHFGSAFLRAVMGQPSDAWRLAFAVCTGLKVAAHFMPEIVGETELCGAAMAKVHIDVDIASALTEVGCISPVDYGNMLVLVEAGFQAALIKLRGAILGAGEYELQQALAPLVGLDVKEWRNAAYTKICNVAVPDVDPGFSKRLIQRAPASTGRSYQTSDVELPAASQLRIGAADDPLERAADRAAESVLGGP